MNTSNPSTPKDRAAWERQRSRGRLSQSDAPAAVAPPAKNELAGLKKRLALIAVLLLVFVAGVYLHLRDGGEDGDGDGDTDGGFVPRSSPKVRTNELNDNRSCGVCTRLALCFLLASQ